MSKNIWRGLVGVAALVAAGAAIAQQPPALRVTGTVESVAGNVVSVKSDKMGDVKISLTDNAAVFGISKGGIGDIKQGSYIGVGAMPQADGSQKAIRITVFAEVQRGVGEGHRPWDLPNSTMTNGAVDKVAGSIQDRVLMVTYKGGEQKVTIPPEAVILVYEVGNKSELKPGAKVAVLGPNKKPDGTLEANRINVGRGDVVP